MKRIGVLTLGAALVAAVSSIAACGGDEEVGPGNSSSSGDGGTLNPDATTSSSGGGPDCPAATPVDPNCNTTKCTADNGGAKSICVAGACQRLVMEGAGADDCKAGDLVGAVDDDRAIWIGGSLAMIAAGGKINPSGPPRRNSIEFAIDEINEKGGIPGVGECGVARKLAAIVCDDGGGRNASGMTDVTDRIGAHLANDLGIQAVIGGGTSGPTIALATNSLLPKGALIIAPSSTAIAITDLAGATVDGDRLVWRTAPSDLLQSKALLKLYDAYVAAHAGPHKLAIVDKGDAYGKGLGDAVQTDVMLNGAHVAPVGSPPGADFYRGTCAASAAPLDGGGSACQVNIDALVALRPTIIMLPGTAESITQVMIPYEASLGGGDPKPFYFIPDGPAKPELFAAVKAQPELATRIQGTVPGAVTPLASNFFNFGYKSKYPQSPDADGNMVDSTLLFGMAGSYDATYLLAYAMIATNTDSQTFTGSQFAKGFAKTINGAAVDVGPANFLTAVTPIRASGIDFNGASGPLNFDLAKGEAPSNVIIWCVRKNPNSATGDFQRFDDTGQTFDSLTSELEGPYSCPQL